MVASVLFADEVFALGTIYSQSVYLRHFVASISDGRSNRMKALIVVFLVSASLLVLCISLSIYDVDAFGCSLYLVCNIFLMLLYVLYEVELDSH